MEAKQGIVMAVAVPSRQRGEHLTTWASQARLPQASPPKQPYSPIPTLQQRSPQHRPGSTQEMSSPGHPGRWRISEDPNYLGTDAEVSALLVRMHAQAMRNAV